MSLIVMLLWAFQVARAAPAGPADRNTDWQQYLRGSSTQPGLSWPHQHQGSTSSDLRSNYELQDAGAGYWSPANSHFDSDPAQSSQHWGEHAHDIQPSQSWSHNFAPHHPLTQYEHDYSYTPPELNTEDLEMLRDILTDSDNDGTSSVYRSNGRDASIGKNVVNVGHINNDQTHSSLYRDMHFSDAEPSQSWNYASTPHHTISPYDLSHTPRLLNAEELEFLHNALMPSDSEALPPSGRPIGGETNTAFNVAKNPQTDQGESMSSSVPRKRVRKSSQVHGEERIRKQPESLKRTEPEVLRSIPYTEPLGSDRQTLGVLALRPNEKLIQEISSRVFAGKLRVAQEHLFYHLRMEDYFRKWPLRRRNRRLPLISTTAADGKTKLRIHMTDHYSSPRNANLRGTILENKQYYMFFGVPETLQAKNPIEYYGSGYIDVKDHSAVDQHLLPLLKGL